MPNTWNIQKSSQLYNLAQWGGGYFDINDKGHLSVHPYRSKEPAIDLMDVIQDIKEKNLNFPCVIRFQDILHDRVQHLNECFKKTIKNYHYKGNYCGVYPIKVNQLREVIEEIIDAGSKYHFGLEAGSKGELLTVLALNTNPKALTICNGYKDLDYLRLALMGRKLGRRVLIVIEKITELPLLLKMAEEMKVEPMIGLRAKLSTRGSGRWENSGGDLAKFGLTVPEIMQAVGLLKKHRKKRWLKLFHFHVGSQITDIRLIKESVREGARLYAKLFQMGFKLEYFDVGGGLGVDYEGSQSASDSSMNYTLEEYVEDVVYNLQQVCQEEKVPEPNIVSESGRAIVAHHSCLIIPVFGKIKIEEKKSTVKNPKESVVKDLVELLKELKKENALSIFHDAQTKKTEALDKFKLGILSLEDRAQAENLYWKICQKILSLLPKIEHPSEDLNHLKIQMADQYLANFSLFQSAPDHWAFNQLFPILPVHRLKEKPGQETTIVDITCDSDGKIDRFIDLEDLGQSLRLHELKDNEPYYLGMFLTGAYQDIMGDMHNLFGRVHEAHVFVDDEDPEDFYLEEVIRGDRAKDVLRRLQYSPKELAKAVKTQLDQAVRKGKIKPKEGVNLIEFYEEAMEGYTYLEIKD